MRIQYVLTEQEIRQAKDKLRELKQIALISRDAGDMEANREYYLKAKGFEECLQVLQLNSTSKKIKKSKEPY